MIRVTTNGILHNYKSSLMRSSNNLNDARTTVLTQRNFNSYADDPAAATESFQLRRSYSRTSDQITNSTTIINKFDSAWSTMKSVVEDLTDKQGKVSALKGLNGATASGRQALGQVLTQTAESVVQSMNVKYDESYIFAGSDGLTTPFTIDDSTGDLLYCGVNVNSSDAGDIANLDAMNSQTTYVDIGVGLNEDANGNIITSSAFNSAISGIDILGYGVDDDGDPKNIVSIMQEIGDIFTRCDSDTGDFASDEDEKNATRLTQKLEDALSETTSKYSELNTKSSYLESNKTLLKSASSTLNTQITSLEDCELVDAITSFSWAQYCYNAALKVGNSILSQSLMDYMN